MKIRMLRQYNQAVDGKPLPPAGGVVDINPATFAVYLIKIGVAEAVADAPATETKAATPAVRRSKATKSVKETR